MNVLGKKLVEETALKAEAGLLADDDNHNYNDYSHDGIDNNDDYDNNGADSIKRHRDNNGNVGDKVDHGFNSSFLLRLYKKLKSSMITSSSSSSSSLDANEKQISVNDNYIDNVMIKLQSINRKTSNNDDGKDNGGNDKDNDDDVFIVNDDDNDNDNDNDSSDTHHECPICLLEKSTSFLSITTCGHIVCSQCVSEYLSVTKKCMNCSRMLNLKHDITSLHYLGDDDYDDNDDNDDDDDDNDNDNGNGDNMDITSNVKSKKRYGHSNYRRWGDALHRGRNTHMLIHMLMHTYTHTQICS